MKRRSFLHLPMAVPALPVLADQLLTAAVAAPPPKSVLVRAGEDRSGQRFKWQGGEFDVKVSGNDTEGRYVIFDTLRPEKTGPPLHLHVDCDEWFFVLDGEFKFQVDEEIVRLKTGDSLVITQNTPHTFVKTSEGVGRLMIMHQPAVRMEEYFRNVIKLPDQSVEGRRSFAEKHGMRIVGPTLKPD